MANAFGVSTGDIISGIKLVKDLIVALQDSKGSSKEYLQLISELRSLESALTGVKNICFNHQQLGHEVVLREAIRQCRVTIDEFVGKLSKYDPHLRLNGSLKPWHDAFRKIQWRLCTKEDIALFRSKIGVHTQAIQMVLITSQM